MTDVPRAGWSALTLRVMRSTGWYPERSVPVTRWEEPVRAELGLGMHDAVRRFLTEFGGLSTDEWTPGPIMPQSPFRLDPRVAVADREAFARFKESAGARLYPLGHADSGASRLGMSEDGAVWIGTGDGGAQLLADTGVLALEKLVMERHTDAPLPFVLAGDHLEFPGETVPVGARAGSGARWSAEADWMLRRSGWFPGRSVSTAQWEQVLRENDEGFEANEAARRFLTEFGGLELNTKGPGRTMARSPVRLDPLVAKLDFEIFDFLSEEAGTYLYPIGDAVQANQYLGMAENGAVYFGMDVVELLADTADEALDKLIRGIR
ncbi:SUKH-3 domain-containing protein [Streptomyces aidingensis]|uniref:SUKH-3 immunity protein n=1 Tax=Streptomyces aidingensis TaxID=910347 RepID=A0A1I1SHD2_9ACTN|nr:SUKH-3 domain-containing protein [Streptomyces aidingensis]SFD44058.1 SUKH-3 immunity protein [Streptomyces aidingensis]